MYLEKFGLLFSNHLTSLVLKQFWSLLSFQAPIHRVPLRALKRQNSMLATGISEKYSNSKNSTYNCNNQKKDHAVYSQISQE